MKTTKSPQQNLAALSLLSLLAASAPGLASAQGVLVADAGELHLHSGESQQTLLRCTVRNTFKLVVPPYSEQISEGPCIIASLAAHTQTGRWALSVDTEPSPNDLSREIIINGVSHPISLNKDRSNLSSGVLVHGDARGVIHTWPGIPKSRNKKGGVLFQHVDGFSADGSRLWVSLLSSSGSELWSWTLGTAPSGTHLKAPLFSDKETGMLLTDSRQVVIREHNGSKLRAVTLPADGSPSFEQVIPIKRGDKTWRAPLLLGDDLFYYIAGTPAKGSEDVWPPRCDASRPGSYRRLNLKTGEDRAWRDHPGCWEEDPAYLIPGANSPAIFFNERRDGISRLYELDLATDAVRPVPIASDGEALVASADAATLLVREGGTIKLWDVQDERYLWQTPTHGGASARAVFTAGDSPATARAAAPPAVRKTPSVF